MKREPLYTIGGEKKKWPSHYKKITQRSQKIFKRAFSPTIPLLGMYPTEMRIRFWWDIWISIFITALFTTAKTWKQPKCPSTDEQMKKMRCIYSMEYYSVTRKTDIFLFRTTWMNPEHTMLSEVSQTKNSIMCHLRRF